MDAFGIVLSFALILLGAVSNAWWFVFFVAAVTFAAFPVVDTIWWLIAEIAVAWVWKGVFKELSQNGFFLIALLLAAAVIAISLDQVFVGIILSLGIVFLVVLTPGIYSAKKISKKAREEYDEIRAGLQKAKGQTPDLYKETEALAKGGGGFIGESIITNPNQKHTMDDLWERLANASKSVLDGLNRLFK